MQRCIDPSLVYLRVLEERAFWSDGEWKSLYLSGDIIQRKRLD